MEKNLNNDAALEKMKSLVESVNVCMYCTKNEIGKMISRPMGTAKVDDDGTIWFFTDDDTTAAEDAKGTSDVCLNYSSTSSNTYASISGKARLVKDKSKMEELWNDFLKTWFPDGLGTPGISLIAVSPESGQYWESDATRLKLLYSYLKAKVTGEPADGSEGTTGKLKM